MSAGSAETFMAKAKRSARAVKIFMGGLATLCVEEKSRGFYGLAQIRIRTICVNPRQSAVQKNSVHFFGNAHCSSKNPASMICPGHFPSGGVSRFTIAQSGSFGV